MTLKSALQDVKETTLAAVSGLLGKLSYLSSLRHGQDRYQHWGMALIYGLESSDRALRVAHAEVLAGVLRAPLETLTDDLEQSSRASGQGRLSYLESMRERFGDLLAGERPDSPSGLHLNSVLVALSKLEQNRGRSIRSIS